jgi:hypothetical protein
MSSVIRCLSCALGERRVVFLEGEDGHRKDDVRVVRVGEQQLFEETLGFGIAFFADQRTRQMQLYLARIGIAVDKALQRGDGLGGRLRGQDLRLAAGRPLSQSGRSSSACRTSASARSDSPAEVAATATA